MNNLVLPGTAMPHVLWELQGIADAVWEGQVDAQGNASEALQGIRAGIARARWLAHEFDAFVRDTVNFLDYVGEPVQLEAPVARLPRDRFPAVLHAARLVR